MFVQSCLNGSRLPGEHPALPVTPEDLARDACLVRAVGAHAVHLHVKDHSGADTFDAKLTDATIAAIRQSAPGLPVGVTTGAWAAPDPRERMTAIRSWTQLPDYASVNWHEDGAEQIAMTLLDHGIAVEAGLLECRSSGHLAQLNAAFTLPTSTH